MIRKAATTRHGLLVVGDTVDDLNDALPGWKRDLQFANQERPAGLDESELVPYDALQSLVEQGSPKDAGGYRLASRP